ncbi:MAG TPA: hypothetical protein VEL28_02690 [Candidatus Binatia bacterium]|nr:hypothetical protein [Candidatus Binatia bacterium]
MINIGDQVVHQSHPGRFEVVKIEPTPGMNVYSRILTIRSKDGLELRVLDTAVRTVEGDGLRI